MTDETQKMLVRFTQEQVAYTPLSPTMGAACANCRWFINQSDVGAGCHIIENYPADVLATGYCNRHDLLPSFEPTPMPVELVGIGERALGGYVPNDGALAKINTGDHVRHTLNINIQGNQGHKDEILKTLDAALTEAGLAEPHEHEQPESLYAAPDSNDTGVLKSLLDKFKRGLKPGQSVIKAVDGQRYMLIVTSNSYQDREKETIKTAALQEYVNRSWKADDLFASNNPQLFWHDDRLVMGDIVWADVRGPFLVELAKEAPNPIAHKMYDYIEAHPEEKWGASHRFGYYKSDKDADGTYHRIFKQETTTLPRDAAANLLTYSGVLPVTHKDTYLNKMLGLDNASELLDKGIDALVAELQKNGVSHKSVDAPASDPAFVTLAKAFVQVVDDVGVLSDQVEAAQKEYTDKAAALDTTRAQLDEALKAVNDRLATLEAQLDNRPRSASRASETVIEGEAAKGLEQLNVEKHPVFGALRPK